MTTAPHLRDLPDRVRPFAWRTIRDKSVVNPRAIELREQAVEILSESLADATPEQLRTAGALATDIEAHDFAQRIPNPPAPAPTVIEDEIDALNASIMPDMPSDELRAVAARVHDLRRRARPQSGVTVT